MWGLCRQSRVQTEVKVRAAWASCEMISLGLLRRAHAGLEVFVTRWADRVSQIVIERQVRVNEAVLSWARRVPEHMELRRRSLGR